MFPEKRFDISIEGFRCEDRYLARNNCTLTVFKAKYGLIFQALAETHFVYMEQIEMIEMLMREQKVIIASKSHELVGCWFSCFSFRPKS